MRRLQEQRCRCLSKDETEIVGNSTESFQSTILACDEGLRLPLGRTVICSVIIMSKMDYCRPSQYLVVPDRYLSDVGFCLPFELIYVYVLFSTERCHIPAYVASSAHRFLSADTCSHLSQFPTIPEKYIVDSS